MSKTVARSKVFSVTVEVDEARLKLFSKAPDLVEKALTAGAEYFRTGILPGHFERGAAGKYGYAPRSLAYIKKNGGKPYLTKTGAFKAELLARSSARMQGRTLNLKLTARTLNFVPRMSDTSEDLYVKHSNSTKHGYPNMKREVRAMTDDDRASISAVIEVALIEFFGPEKKE